MNMYTQGYSAYLLGIHRLSNPAKSKHTAEQWWKGWYAAERELGSVLAA